MTHIRFSTFIAMGAIAVLATACDRHEPVAPTGENSVLAKAGASDSSGTPSPSAPAPSKPAPGTPADTAPHQPTQPTHTPPPPDSGKSSYTGPVTVSGHILLAQFVPLPAGVMGDTIQTSPLPGASVTLVQLSIEGGQVTVAQATTDANGAFSMPNLTVGTYRLNVAPPAGSSISTAFYQFTAQQANVPVTIQLSPIR